MGNRPDCLAVGLSPAIQKTLLFADFQQGEVNRSSHYYTDAAGKCVNVSRVLSQGGMTSSCLTVAGRENRHELEDLCKRDSVNLISIETEGRVRTCSTIVETESGRCSELVVNEPELITEKEEKKFKSVFLELLTHGYRSVCISGSRLKGISDEIIPFMVKTAKERKTILFVDYRGDDLRNSFINRDLRPDYIKINDEEFFESFGNFKNLETGLIDVSSTYQSVFVISRGSRSTVIADKGELLEVESQLIKPLNPIGCGDSMMAGMVQGIIEGLSIKAAVEKGRDYATLNALSIHPGWILENNNGKRNNNYK